MSLRRIRLRAFAAFALLLFACSADQARNPAFHGECAKADRVNGYCVTSMQGDAGPADAGKRDSGKPDTDCDTDEDLGDTSCATSGRGECMEGRLVCRSGEVVCEPVKEQTAESCDDLDNDCDGSTDELADGKCYPSGEEGCTTQDSGFTCVGLCVAGKRLCEQGALSDSCSDPITPAADDGCTSSGVSFDDDCDGSIDEDCSCTPAETRDCFGGSAAAVAAGTCQIGTITCGNDMRYGACEGDRVPEDETCDNDGSDDDCDGTADNIPGRGDACIVSSAKGVCRTGVFDCVTGGYGCDAPSASAESCNTLDDDCDGTVDNGFVLATDPANCGSCGTTCAEGLACCANGCVNKDSDPMHCGACGAPCGVNETCCSGTCINTNTDVDNCGSCGNDCAADCCAGTCVDKANSDGHCGTCGNGCTDSDICCAGDCEAPDAPACQSCTEDCAATGKSCCNGACADTSNNEAHCGACGNPCGAGQLCCNSQCVASNVEHCGQGCAMCTGSDLCCSSGCTESNASNCNACGNVCVGGQTCCGATGCKTLASDPNNCGTCGTPVPANNICSKGHPCPTGQTWCDNINNCTNLQTDKLNCGACGADCLLGLPCSNGKCLKL